MPAEWVEHPLGDLCKEITVGHVGSMTKEYRDEGIPFFRSKNIREYRIDWNDVKYVSHDFHRALKKSALRPGDVAVVRTGKPGTACVIPEEVVEANCSDLVIARVHPQLLSAHYLSYYLNSVANHQISSRLVGAVQQHFNVGAAKELSIRIPPLKEQERIVEVVKGLDDKIQLNHQINQTLEQIAQAIFKSWFVNFEPVKAKIAARERWLALQPTTDSASPVCYTGEVEPLPDLDAYMNLAAMQVISGKDEAQLTRFQVEQPGQYAELLATAELFPAAMVESELGEIPDSWSAVPLYETAEYINGAAFKGKDFSEDGSGLPIVKIAELKQGITAGTKFTHGQFKDKYRIKSGDILYSWSGSPETSLEVFKWFGGDGWLNQHIFKLNFSEGQSIHFTYFLLKQMKPVLIRTAKQKQTTGLGHVTVADMKRIRVAFPSQPVLSAYSELVGPLYERGSEAMRESSSLIQTREALLPKLLSGELSISVATTQTAELEEVAHV